MVEKEQDALSKKFDNFSAQLEARVREFKERGAFTPADEAGSRAIRDRLDAIRRKLHTAVSEGASWEIVKYDLERDFTGVTEALTSFGERLDAETEKQAVKPRRR